MYFSPTETIFGIHGRVSRVAATACLRRLGPEVSKRPLSEFRRRCYTTRTSTTTGTYLTPSRKPLLADGYLRAGFRSRTALQRLGDPAPAMRLVTYRPHDKGLGRVGELGDDADQLAVKVIRRLRPVVRAGRHQRHGHAIAASQPGGDVAVVVPADPRDRIGPDEVTPVVLAHPDVRRIHRRHLPAHCRGGTVSRCRGVRVAVSRCRCRCRGVAAARRHGFPQQWHIAPATGAARPPGGAAAMAGTRRPGRRRPPPRPGWAG